MGFNDAVRELIAALVDGRFQAVARGDKNYLENGKRTPDQVVAMLRACKQDRYATSPHHDDASIEVHIFKPVIKHIEWYIKAFFVDDEGQEAIIISVHPSGK